MSDMSPARKFQLLKSSETIGTNTTQRRARVYILRQKHVAPTAKCPNVQNSDFSDATGFNELEALPC